MIDSADVAALGDVVRIAEALHQLRPGSRDAAGAPTDFRGLAGEAVAGDGRQDEVECVLGGSAVSGRVGQRADGLEQLDHRAGPAVGHDQRQRVLVLRADVDEVDLHSVDLGRVLRKRIEPRLDPAEVVVLRPVAGELLDRRELHSLRAVLDELPGGQSRRGDAPPQVVDLLVRDVDAEGADIRGCVDSSAHDFLRCYRSERNAARTSVEKSSGSSQAAKWPPLSGSL